MKKYSISLSSAFITCFDFRFQSNAFRFPNRKLQMKMKHNTQTKEADSRKKNVQLSPFRCSIETTKESLCFDYIATKNN